MESYIDVLGLDVLQIWYDITWTYNHNHQYDISLVHCQSLVIKLDDDPLSSFGTSLFSNPKSWFPEIHGWFCQPELLLPWDLRISCSLRPEPEPRNPNICDRQEVYLKNHSGDETSDVNSPLNHCWNHQTITTSWCLKSANHSICFKIMVATTSEIQSPLVNSHPSSPSLTSLISRHIDAKHLNHLNHHDWWIEHSPTVFHNDEEISHFYPKPENHPDIAPKYTEFPSKCKVNPTLEKPQKTNGFTTDSDLAQERTKCHIWRRSKTPNMGYFLLHQQCWKSLIPLNPGWFFFCMDSPIGLWSYFIYTYIFIIIYICV